MCFQHKAGEQIPPFLILRGVLGLEGAQLLPGLAPLARQVTQHIPGSQQSSHTALQISSGSTLTCPSYWQKEVPRWVL